MKNSKIFAMKSGLCIIIVFIINLLTGCVHQPIYLNPNYESNLLKSVAVLPCKISKEIEFEIMQIEKIDALADKIAERMCDKDYDIVPPKTVKALLFDNGINVEDINTALIPTVCNLFQVDGVLINSLLFYENMSISNEMNLQNWFYYSNSDSIWVSEFIDENSIAPFVVNGGILGALAYALEDQEKIMIKKAFESLPDGKGNGDFLMTDYKLKYNFNFLNKLDFVNLTECRNLINSSTKLLKENPEHAGIYFSRGNSYKQLNMYVKAFDDLFNAVKLKPDNKTYETSYAEILMLTKNYENSIKEYDRIIEAYPEDHISRYKRGLAKYYQGDYKGALVDMNVDPSPIKFTSTQFADLGFLFFDLKQYNDAMDKFEKALQFEKIDRRIYLGMALTLFEQGKFSEAKEYLKISNISYPELKEKNIVLIERKLEEDGCFLTFNQKAAILKVFEGF